MRISTPGIRTPSVKWDPEPYVTEVVKSQPDALVGFSGVPSLPTPLLRAGCPHPSDSRTGTQEPSRDVQDQCLRWPRPQGQMPTLAGFLRCLLSGLVFSDNSNHSSTDASGRAEPGVSHVTISLSCFLSCVSLANQLH